MKRQVAALSICFVCLVTGSLIDKLSEDGESNDGLCICRRSPSADQDWLKTIELSSTFPIKLDCELNNLTPTNTETGDCCPRWTHVIEFRDTETLRQDCKREATNFSFSSAKSDRKFDLIYVIEKGSNNSVEQVSKSISCNLSQPWFYTYSEDGDTISMVSTVTGKLDNVDNMKEGHHTLNLGGQEIRVAFLPEPESSSLQTFNLKVLDIIAKRLNFTPVFHKPAVGGYGSEDSFGNFDGIIGELQNSRADIGLGVLTISLSRNRAAVSSSTITFMRYNIYYSKNGVKKGIYWTAFLEVLDKGLWLATALMALLSAAIIFVILIVHLMWKESARNLIYVVIATTGITLRSLACLDPDIVGLKKHSMRVSVFSLSLCSAIVFWSYNGCLISYLAVDINQHPFTSFLGLARQMPSDYKLYIPGGGYAESFIRKAIDQGQPNFLAIEDRIEPKSTLREIQTSVVQGKGAVLVVSGAVDSCKLRWNGMTLREVGTGWYYNQNFQLKEDFDRQISRLREEGILDSLRAKYIFDPEKCFEKAYVDPPKPISGPFVVSLFTLLASGIILSLVCFSCELLVKWYLH